MTCGQLKELLKKLRACKSSRDWVQRQIKKGKSPKEIWDCCNNGDYLFWLSRMLDIFDWVKFDHFKINRGYRHYSNKEYRNIRYQFIRKHIKYKDLHKAAIKVLKKK